MVCLLEEVESKFQKRKSEREGASEWKLPSNNEYEQMIDGMRGGLCTDV